MRKPLQHRSTLELEIRARELRKDATPSEDLFWQAVRGRKLNGLKFRRQQTIGPFIADFYCEELSLVIEIDGPVHDSVSERDHLRDDWLESNGFHALRFTNAQIASSLSSVLQQISDLASEAQKAPLPWERGWGEGDS